MSMDSASEDGLPAQPSRENGHADSAAVVPAAPTLLVDLNSASADELRQLRGIGRALAERILQRRALLGRFGAVDELRQVPGISRATYDAIAGLVCVSEAHEPASANGSAEPAEGEAPVKAEAPVGPHPAEAAGAEAPPTPLDLEPAPASPPVIEPAVDEPAPKAPLAVPPAPVQAAAPAIEAPPQPIALPPAPIPIPDNPPPKPAQTPLQVPVLARSPAASRDWTGLMGMSLLGALLGSVLTLLLLAGLNRGTLVLNEQDQLVTLSGRVDQLHSQAGSLETQSQALRSRLEALESLSARVGSVESGLGQAKEEVSALQDETARLNSETKVLSQEVTAVRAAAKRFDAFLAGLRSLLGVPGATEAAPSATSTPAATTASPVASGTPAPTSTPAHTPTKPGY